MKTELQKILYVEDDPDIQLIGMLALQQVGGFSTVVASSGEEALGLAENCKPDLILLDVMMPGMDGITTLNKLRENLKFADIPVIFMTAKTQKSELDSYLESGALAVIPKPFDPMTLADQVSEIWQRDNDCG